MNYSNSQRAGVILYLTALIFGAYDGKLHCLDDQLPFELPEGWEWCNLSMIGTTNIGLTYRPTDITADGINIIYLSLQLYIR